MHPAELQIEKLLQECETRRGRRSGPGGQHRNKVETAIVLIHRPTGIKAEATERRSQHENKSVASQRLRVNLALGVRISRNEQDVPSALWQGRSGGQRIQVNPEHADFPALLAEALDVVADGHYDVTAAAKQLKISTSQLVKFLRSEPRAMAQVNQQRRDRGLRPLH
jgi:hypothetical protein